MLLADGWEEDQGEPRSLPLALTAINASAWLWTLLHDDRCFYIRGVTLHTYHDLFCEIMCGFLHMWKREAPLSIGEFERVQSSYLEEVKKRLDGKAERIAELVVSAKMD